MQPFRPIVGLLFLFVTSALTGCAALDNAFGKQEHGYDPAPLKAYGGTRQDAEYLAETPHSLFPSLAVGRPGPVWSVLQKIPPALDLPLSLVGDTLLFPVVIVRGEALAADLRSSHKEHVSIGPFAEPAEVTLEYHVGRWSGIEGVYRAPVQIHRSLKPGEAWNEDLAGWVNRWDSSLKITRPNGAVFLQDKCAVYGPEQFRQDPQAYLSLWLNAMDKTWRRDIKACPDGKNPPDFTPHEIETSLALMLNDGLDPDAADAPDQHPLVTALKPDPHNYGDAGILFLLEKGYPKKNRQAVLDAAIKSASGNSRIRAYLALAHQGARLDGRVVATLDNLASIAGKHQCEQPERVQWAKEEIRWLLVHGAPEAMDPTPRVPGVHQYDSDRPVMKLARDLLWDGYEDSALLLLAKPALFDAQDRQYLLHAAVRSGAFHAADTLVGLGASPKEIPWTAAFESHYSNVAPSHPRIPILHWLKTRGGAMDGAVAKINGYDFSPKDGVAKQWVETLPGLLCDPAERAALRRLAPTKWDARIDGRTLAWSDCFASIREPEEITFILDWMSARGANLGQKVDGKTLIGCAAEENNTAMIAWLLAHGSDPNAPDDGGKLPMDRDLWPQNEALLKKAGGRPTDAKIK